MKNRRFGLRPATATPRTRHNGATPAEPEQSPRPPHADTATLAPFAELYPYQPYTVDALRGWIERLRGEAADDETDARELYDRAQRKTAMADDVERMLTLLSADALRIAQAPLGAAMGRDQLLNGWQPGFEAKDPRPAMQSTDPDTQHTWRVTHHPVGADPYVHLDAVSLSDAEVEAIAEQAGERAAVTYARGVPVREGHRHAVQLALRSGAGNGCFVYERIDESRPSQDGDTERLPRIPAEVSR